MKRITIDSMFAMAIIGLLCRVEAPAQEDEMIRKAANITPSPRQYAWQQLETIAFLHFGINTFTDREWGEGTESPSLFNPSALDARQWARVCKEAGLKMIILTAKHHDGFCLWPSAWTEHSLKNAPWRNGRGDIVREVADACRAYGLKFGFYLSPWDRHEPGYGDSPRYNAFFTNQLRELLSNYGEISEVWFDGACGEGPNGVRQVYDFPAWYRLIRELQPNAVIAIMGPDVRWVGSEDGYARESEWSVLPAAAQNQEEIAADSQQQISAEGFIPQDRSDSDLGSRDKIRGAKKLVWYPAEADVSIRPGWFYHANQDERVKTPEKLLDIYYGSVGRNAVLLLNIPPDQRGLIHERDISALREMRRILDATFARNLLEEAVITGDGGAPLHALTDHSLKTFWRPEAAGDSAILIADFATAHSFDLLMLQENIRAGQRIEAFALQIEEQTGWRTVASGTTVGYKRLLRFPPVTAARVRLLITRSRIEPTLAQWGLYRRPPQVGIRPPGGAFMDSLTVALSTPHEDAEIHYTRDGTAPCATSPRYQAPLRLTQTTTVRAIAIADGRAGLMCEAEFTRAHCGLHLAAPYAAQYSAGGPLALLDGKRGSSDFNDGCWQGFEGVDLDATLDLGAVREIENLEIGFLNDPGSWIFLPQVLTSEYSADGRVWEPLPGQIMPDLSSRQRYAVSMKIDRAFRWLRVRAKNRGVCPPGHPGAGGKAWLFIDEIAVK